MADRQQLRPGDRRGDVCARTDSFWQDGALDILFVVDPSDHAGGARERLINALPDLIDPVVGPGRSTQFGVASMDLLEPHGGQLIRVDGNWFVGGWGIDPATVQWFLSQALDLGPPQGGIGARAVTKAAVYDYRSIHNAGFDREGVHLALIYLTTTEDYGDPSLEGLTSVLDEIEGPGRWSAHAIVQTETTDCWGKPAMAHQGVSFLDLAEASGGLVLDHCTLDYAAFANDVARQLAAGGLRDTFVLSEGPKPNSVNVQLESLEGDVTPLAPHEYTVDGSVVTLETPPGAATTIVIHYEAVP